MVDALQVFCVILVAFAMVPVVAHALELPGKRRLNKDAYFAVQPIYYPGFTIAGISEPVAILATIALVIATPRGDVDFWSTLAALVALLVSHAVYWLVTHPVNNFWLQGEKLSGAGSRFFSIGSQQKREPGNEAVKGDWMRLRNRWEYSHVARACFAFVSFVALVIVLSSASGA